MTGCGKSSVAGRGLADRARGDRGTAGSLVSDPGSARNGLRGADMCPSPDCIGPLNNGSGRMTWPVFFRFLSLRHLDETEAVIETRCHAWNALVAGHGRPPSLCAHLGTTKVG